MPRKGLNGNRDYQKENREYHSQPEQKKKRAMRNKARRQALAEGTVEKGDDKHVHHKTPLRSGGSNAPSNRQVTSAESNYGWRKGKKGEIR